MDVVRSQVEKAFAAEGLQPDSWTSDGDYTFEVHAHDYETVMYCVRGEITVQLPSGGRTLRPGDRIEIPADTEHAATVGPDGVECMEAHIYPGI